MNRLKMPVWTLAGGLIVLQMILIAIIVHGESLTFDEGDHIARSGSQAETKICQLSYT
jgi:hypothetical protein